jgi:predicted DsbA family dithiol-disulfide isomerase
MFPSSKLVGSRHSSRESKKPVQGEEGLHGKEDLTPKYKRQEDSRRQVKKEKKPIGEKDGGEVIVE